VQLLVYLCRVKFDKILETSPDYLVPYLGKTMKDIDILINTKLRLGGYDLTKNQLILLRCIHFGVKSQTELSFITNRNKSSLTRLIQGMEKKGLINRTPDTKDKRHQIVEITASGNDLYKKAMPEIEQCFELMESGLLKKQLKQTKETLFKIQENVQKELEKIQ